jgi:drug/metabolite transporter (DMT)-like permease
LTEFYSLKKLIPYIAIVCAMLIWAGAGIAVKHALVVFPPLTLIVLRFTLAVILMFIIGVIFRRNEILGLQRVERQHLPLFLVGGILQPFLYFILETYTYQSFTSPTIAEALLSTQPILAPIFAFLLLREQVTRYNIIGILISTAGMLLLLLTSANSFSIGNPWGILLAILTVSCSVGYSVVLRRIPTQYSSLTIVFYVQSISLILFYLLWGGGQLFNATPFINTDVLSIQDVANPILSTIYLSVFASVAAFILFCFTVRYIGVTRANIFNNIRPVFTALLMLIIFHEQLPIWKWIGIIVIIIGLFISQKQEKYNIY